VVYIPKLIRDVATNVEDLRHLGEVARHDPIAYYVTYGIANKALGNWFLFVDTSGNEIMKNVQREMRVLKVKEVMIQALAYERAYGWAYVYTGKNRYVPQTPEGGRLASLHAFTPEECVVKVYNDVGEPVSMELTVNVGEGEYTTREKKITLPAEDFIFLNTRPIGRGYQGKSALEPIWSTLVGLRDINHAMIFYDSKIAHGLFYVKTKGGIPDELVTKLNVALEDVSHKRAFVVDGSKVEAFGWEGAPAGASDFPAHIDIGLGHVAAGTGIARDQLVGATGGTNEAAQTSEKSSHKQVTEVQGDIEHAMRELVVRMGFNNSSYDFLWNARYAHDEEEQSKIEMNRAQTLAIRSNWLTINEIRAEDGLPPTEGGDRLKADFEMAVQMEGGEEQEQTPEEREKTNNPGGTQV
jgi:hypothetical protein